MRRANIKASAYTSLPRCNVVVARRQRRTRETWTPPSENTDGTQLTNLSGYRIYYGTSSTALTQTVDITNASVSSHLVGRLSPST